MAQPESDPRIYFAAERTFLAWIRTGLGLMGRGIRRGSIWIFPAPVARECVRYIDPFEQPVALVRRGDTVVLGVLVNISAVTEHFRVIAHRMAAGSRATCPEMQSFLLFCWR